MKKMSLKNIKGVPLTVKEMKGICAGSYIGYTCKNGGGSGGSSNSNMSTARSLATANCGAGNYYIIQVGYIAGIVEEIKYRP
jgi:hypothetical protein